MKLSSIQQHLSKMSISLRVLIGVLILTFFISIVFFVHGITQVRHKGVHPHNPLGIIFSGSRQPLGNIRAEDIDSIDVWMTFSYINFTFGLKDTLLKDALHIDIASYPRLSLQSYIRKKKLDKTTFLKEVKDAVRSSFPINPQK